jgi:hypothetical protein
MLPSGANTAETGECSPLAISNNFTEMLFSLLVLVLESAQLPNNKKIKAIKILNRFIGFIIIIIWAAVLFNNN